MNGLHVAWVLLLTRLRRLLDRSDRRRAQLLALLGFSPVLYQFFQTGSTTTLEGLVGYGGLLAGLFVGIVVMQVFRTIQQFSSFAGMEQLVPFATLQGAVTGFVLADTVTFMVFLMLPLSVFAVPFAATTGLVLVPVVLVAGLSLPVFAATVIGTLVGMTARRIIAVYHGGHRFLLRVLALIAIIVIVDRSIGAWIDPSSLAVGGGIGSQVMATMLAPVTGTAASITGTVTLVVPVLIAVPLFRPLARLTEHVWLFDPVSTEDHRTGGAGFSGDGVRLYARVLWIRSLRSPERLSHLLIESVADPVVDLVNVTDAVYGDEKVVCSVVLHQWLGLLLVHRKTVAHGLRFVVRPLHDLVLVDVAGGRVVIEVVGFPGILVDATA